MMQGGLMAGDLGAQNLLLCPHPIFRKRMRVEELEKRGSTSRCLFGVPDPLENSNLMAKIEEAACADFRGNWNFDPRLGLPTPTLVLGETDERSQGGLRWTQVISQDEMAVENESRFEVPMGPNRGPVTLLFAPSPLCPSKEETERPEMKPVVGDSSPLNVSMESVSAEEEEGSPTLRSQSPKGHSPSRQSHMPSPPVKRFVSSISVPNLKQRCITDYMKVKKSSRAVKKILR